MAFDKTYLRTAEFPTIWCPGCGHGIVTQAAIRACNEKGWDKDEVFAVSGIGCSARTPAYMDFNSVQTTHGRALAFATGMKMTRPEKKVFLMLGDGDASSIGGNHFVHTCRRNIDMTIVVLNNYIYGMTGGQVSPTTPYHGRSTTTVYGSIDEPLDICKLAIAAGATYVARGTAFHAAQLPALIRQGFDNKGTSVIEILSPCPTGFGRNNAYKTPADLYMDLRDRAVPAAKAKTMTAAELEGKIVTGVLHQEPRAEYIDRYKELIGGIKESDELHDIGGSSPAAEDLPSARYECRLSGSGGQGLLLSGILFSEAMIRQGKNAVHTQSYGVEARGGASRSEVVISDREISFPEVSSPDLLLCMTQDAYNRFAGGVKAGGIILSDSTFVTEKPLEGVRSFSYPISDYARNTLGELRAANIVALGILTGLCGFISKEAMLASILSRLPKKLHDLNRQGFEHGYKQGGSMLSSEK